MAQSYVVEEKGMGTLEIFPLDTSEKTLYTLLEDIYTNHWQEIAFGILIQGAAWEIKAPARPKIGMSDGYMTVDFGSWHFHICIGEHKGTKKYPVDPELAAHRRTSRAELYRELKSDGTPNSWGLRLFNGKGEQQMTVFLPNPFLSVEDQSVLKEPNWSHLELWDYLRKIYLGLEPDEKDRSGKRFFHP
jgi:hypothetical protein